MRSPDTCSAVDTGMWRLVASARRLRNAQTRRRVSFVHVVGEIAIMNSIHIRRVAVVIVAAVILAAAVVVSIRAFSSRVQADTPERFGRLSGLLLKELAPRDTPVVRPTDAEATLALERRVAQLAAVADEGNDLGAIAASAHDHLHRAVEVARSVKGPQTLFLGLAEAAIGLSLGSMTMAESGSQSSLEEAADYANAWRELISLHRALEVDRLKLVECAPRFSGAERDSPLLRCEFTEDRPSTLRGLLGDTRLPNAMQTLTLASVADIDLTNCVLVVRLVEDGGGSYQHFYAIPRWRKGEAFVLTYQPGGIIPPSSDDVSRVMIRLFAREASSRPIELARVNEAWPATPATAK